MAPVEAIDAEVYDQVTGPPPWMAPFDDTVPDNTVPAEPIPGDDDGWLQMQPAHEAMYVEMQGNDIFDAEEDPDGAAPLDAMTRKKLDSYIARLHDTLHHPPAERLARMLQRAGAHREVVKAAREYQCEACRSQ